VEQSAFLPASLIAAIGALLGTLRSMIGSRSELATENLALRHLRR